MRQRRHTQVPPVPLEFGHELIRGGDGTHLLALAADGQPPTRLSIAAGVYEAIYILDGLIKNTSDIADRLEQIVATFGDALPVALKLRLFRVAKWIRIEAYAYRCLPHSLEGEPEDHFRLYFRRRFIDTARSLQELSELAELHRKKLFPEPERNSEGVPTFFLAA